MKRSSRKSTLPGRHQVFRSPAGDVIGLADERPRPASRCSSRSARRPPGRRRRRRWSDPRPRRRRAAPCCRRPCERCEIPLPCRPHTHRPSTPCETSSLTDPTHHRPDRRRRPERLLPGRRAGRGRRRPAGRRDRGGRRGRRHAGRHPRRAPPGHSRSATRAAPGRRTAWPARSAPSCTLGHRHAFDIVQDKGGDPEREQLLRLRRHRPGRAPARTRRDRVLVAGLATDYCVRATALDASRGLRPPSSATRSPRSTCTPATASRRSPRSAAAGG